MTTGRINQVASYPTTRSYCGSAPHRRASRPHRTNERPTDRACERASERTSDEPTNERTRALATDHPSAGAHALCAETTATDAIGLAPRGRGPSVGTTGPRDLLSARATAPTPDPSERTNERTNGLLCQKRDGLCAGEPLDHLT